MKVYKKSRWVLGVSNIDGSAAFSTETCVVEGRDPWGRGGVYTLLHLSPVQSH